MHLLKTDHFLKEVLAYIKFTFDRAAIRTELEDHISDKIDYYTEQGMEEETAEQLAIKDMGNAKEIGIALNKQHNPILGWTWMISKIVLVLIVAWNVYFFGASILFSLSSHNLVKEIPSSDIEYRIDLNKTIKLDDLIIKFTNVVYEKDGNLNIFYEYYDSNLWTVGTELGYFFNITDNLGNDYHLGPCYGSSSIYKNYFRASYENFSEEADALILSYNYYNRNFTIELPLKEGDKNE